MNIEIIRSVYLTVHKNRRIGVFHVRHKGVMCAPLLGPVDLSCWLSDSQIEEVLCGGENYDGARPCDDRWVRSLSRQCRQHNVSFQFIETGSVFVKDGRTWHFDNKWIQSVMAARSGYSFRGRPISFLLQDEYGPIPEMRLVQRTFAQRCQLCGSRQICNGCCRCGRCR